MLDKEQTVATPPTSTTGVVRVYGIKEIKEVFEYRDKGYSQRETAQELGYSRNVSIQSPPRGAEWRSKGEAPGTQDGTGASFYAASAASSSSGFAGGGIA